MLTSRQRATPLFGQKVVVKYDVTQWESCFSISPIPLFALDLDGNALRVYARGYSSIKFKSKVTLIESM